MSILKKLILLSLTLAYQPALSGDYHFAYHPGKTEVTYPSGSLATTTFDKEGQILSESQQSNDGQCKIETRYEYSNGYPSKAIHPNGSITTTKYNNKGLLEEEVENADSPLAFRTRYLWTDARLPKTINYSNGLTLDFTYDNKHNSLRIAESDGSHERSWEYTYNQWGQPLTAKTPYNTSEELIQYTYDDKANLKTATNQLGHKIHHSAYDVDGNVLSETDENGITTTYEYDLMGWLLAKTTANHRTTIKYDPKGKISQVTSPSGIVQNYHYSYWDDLHWFYQGNAVSLYSHDQSGNVTRKVLGYLKPNQAYPITPSNIADITYDIRYQYNDLNQLTQVIDAEKNSTQYQYDTAGNVTKIINAKGDVTQQSYNLQNNLVATQNALNDQTHIDYDASGNVIAITDYRGNKTQYEYNLFNHLTKLISPDQGTVEYAYNQKGQLSDTKDANGTHFYYAYDVLNRLSTVSYNQHILKQYTYDQGLYGKGQLSSVKNDTTAINYEYNGFGNIIRQNHHIKDQTHTVKYRYNADQNVTGITYPSGLKLDYHYDSHGNIAKITTDDHTIASDIHYLPFGGVTQLTYGSGNILTKTYNKSYQLIDQKVSGVVSQQYLYDLLGNITQFINHTSPLFNKTYQYDALERLTTMTSAMDVQKFTYDANGNRLTYDRRAGSTAYQYDADSNKLSHYNDGIDHSVNYDTNGNIIQLSDLSFSYDVFNNLTRVTKDDQTIATYEYNPLNQRVSKTTDGVTTTFIYDQFDQLIEIRKPGTLIDILYLEGEPIAQFVNGAIYYFFNNPQGTPEYLLDQNGQQRYTVDINPFYVSDLSDITQELRFAGQSANAETGLVYNNAREYVPFLGRYLQPDPLGLASGSLNNYVYAENNPVNLTDPTGQYIQLISMMIRAATAYKVYKTTKNINTALSVAKTPTKVAKATQAAKEGKVCAGKSTHKNSLEYKGQTHVYSIRNESQGYTHKIGESAQGLNKHGQSIRAEQQAQRLRKTTGDHFTTNVHKNFSTKADARTYETRFIERYRKLHGETLPDGGRALRGNLTNR